MAGGLHGDDLDDLHEINVTPFIDVMLVLLIIFMVAAPLATVDVHVDLPPARGVASERPDTPLWLTLAPDQAVMLGDQPVSGSLAEALDAATGGARDTRVFLRADESLPYGAVMAVMNQLRDAGYHKIAMVGLDAPEAAPETARETAP